MARHPKITRMILHRFAWDLADMGVDDNGFNHVAHDAGKVVCE